MIISSAGHVFDMISRMKNNLANVKKKSYFKIKQDFVRTASRQNIDFREATKLELEAIRRASP